MRTLPAILPLIPIGDTPPASEAAFVADLLHRILTWIPCATELPVRVFKPLPAAMLFLSVSLPAAECKHRGVWFWQDTGNPLVRRNPANSATRKTRHSSK
jgi:hypothetical protein